MHKKREGLFVEVKEVVSKIPKGKVSTYGAVAKVLGLRDVRKVGWAIYGNQDPKVPCHRVVNKEGFCAPKFSLGGPEEQKARLEADGVEVGDDYKVDLEKYLFSF